jgi:3-isopropylmalate/(R)-2-methylmalate dehydratase small subunit
MMEHIGELLIPDFPKKAQKDDIWVAGTNLGCCSSRNAPLYLKYKGVGAVVCDSAARLFYRNAINSGLPIFDIGQEVKKIKMGDTIKVDVKKGLIMNVTTGEQIRTKPFPDFIMAILEAGGINEYIIAHKNQYELLK